VVSEQQRIVDEIRRRAAGSVGQYGGDVAFLLDALEAALASIRWRDALAEEWSEHMRALGRVLEAADAVPDPGYPRPDWYFALREAIDATDHPAEHKYTRGPET
jgi:hypothetical protein